MKQFLLKCKEIDLTYHAGNNKRRVNYNKKDFDVLLIHFSLLDKELLYAINAKYLPDIDSIHLKYDPLLRRVNWSPKALEIHIKDVTGLM